MTTTPVTTTPVSVYAVGCSHLDTQWLWTLKDTITVHLPKTCVDNFTLFERFPEYVFSFEGAFRYQLLQEYHPALFARVRDLAASGRWVPAGAALDANDMLVPSVESQIRNLLIGNRYFLREFGRRCDDIFLPDCFGFPAALPTIARHCGLHGFCTIKLYSGPSRPIPFAVGCWEGPDGSRIVAVLDPGMYNSKLDADLRPVGGHPETLDAKLTRLRTANSFDRFMILYGVGDSGGAPEAATVEHLQRRQRQDGAVTVRMAASDQMFRDMSEAEIAQLPVYRGELLLKTHGVGCYTSHAAMKRLNRQNEVMAEAAERFAVMAAWVGAEPAPIDDLTANWTRFLCHQFHDDLTGTSIPAVYRISWNDEHIALNRFTDVMETARSAMTRRLDTRVEGIPVVVSNPLAHDRQEAVEAIIRWPGPAPAQVRVFDGEGVEAPSQIIARKDDVLTVLFRARVPSLGQAVYDVRKAEEPCGCETGLRVTADQLENGRYRVRLNARGDIASITDLRLGRELLSGPCQIQLFNDHPGQWPAWEIRYEDIAAAPRTVVGRLPINHPLYDGQREHSATIIESGPVRITLEVARRACGSTFVQRLSLLADPEAPVIMDFAVDWHSRATLAKLAFRLAAKSPHYTADGGIGVTVREINTPQAYEQPSQTWVDQISPDGRFGTALMSDCKYGWDKPDDAQLRLSLLHTPAWDFPPEDRERNAFVWWPEMMSLDHGHHAFRVGLMGHAGDWRQAAVPQRAACFHHPLSARQAMAQPGSCGRRWSFGGLDHPQVALMALKPAEDGSGCIVRLVETAGMATGPVSLSLGDGIASAEEVDGIELPVGPAELADGRLCTRFQPWQVRAFRLHLRECRHPVPAHPCHFQDIPFDTQTTRHRGEPGTGPWQACSVPFQTSPSGPAWCGGPSLSTKGYSFPTQLFPAQLRSGGVAFRLGSAEGPHAVICRGQNLELTGTGDQLDLLMARTDGDADAVLQVDGQAASLATQAAMGPIGQWDRRPLDDAEHGPLAPAFVRPAPIAWLASHVIKPDGEPEVYEPACIFRHTLVIPGQARTLTLPDDPRLFLFAITRSQT